MLYIGLINDPILDVNGSLCYLEPDIGSPSRCDVHFITPLQAESHLSSQLCEFGIVDFDRFFGHFQPAVIVEAVSFSALRRDVPQKEFGCPNFFLESLVEDRFVTFEENLQS